ncbi:hypothetical protein IV203_017131 [Nitzschia inconspicua]|uniref:TFIIS N-terminal domain-containing protein n=1 Tax=Nitzschia inconspicua TaxID=303405 RepID=A0A9K3KRQ2_9STRA|nr:hypothetical protein IV203_017131 [Nitzschia inconspicua]
MGSSSNDAFEKNEKQAIHLAELLSKDIIDSEQVPNMERCLDLLKELEVIHVNIVMLESTKLGKLLRKTIKTLTRHQRTASDDVKNDLRLIIEASNKILEKWKAIAEKEVKSKMKKKEAHASCPGLPNSKDEYRARLVKQKKDMYKDPPAMPPAKVQIELKLCKLPKRDAKSGELTFTTGEDNSIKAVLKEFHPNRTPEEVLRAGSFGGTYFRPIMSAVTNTQYKSQDVLKETLLKEWIDGIPMTSLTSSSYREHVNKYGVKCGGSLGMWESSGWIADSDPYGWFQWYCRFYQGRRCSDDARQISRWLKSAGPKGRFRSQLCNKILAAKAKCDDKSISPVIRQTLLHWGLEITPEILEKHRKRVGK